VEYEENPEKSCDFASNGQAFFEPEQPLVL